MDRLERQVAQAYQEHAAGLYRYGLVVMRNRESAQDAVQEAFLRYFIAVSEGQRIESVKAWLFRVLHNYMLDTIKSAGAKNEIGLDEIHQSADIRQDPELRYHHAELTRRLWSVLAPRELECLRLRNEGFCYDEIAAILSVRSGTVGALLARAQKKMRRLLEAPDRSLAGELAGNPC